MVRKTILVLILCALVVVYLPGGVSASPSAAEKRGSITWWGIGVKWHMVATRSVVKAGAAVTFKGHTSPYAYATLIGNGCYNVNPTKVLANISYCVKNWKKTSRSLFFQYRVEACLGAWRFKTCKSTAWTTWSVAL